MGVVILFALMTGFFYSFSVTVMPGLDVTEPNAAILGMQGINTAVRNGVFFATFFLGPVFAALVGTWMFVRGQKRSALKLFLAALIYGVGVIVLTAQVNVPMNESLAQVTGTIANPGGLWSEFSERWTNWNTVRTVFSGIAMMLAISALPPARSA
jgi:uncharacterized membrane protein